MQTTNERFNQIKKVGGRHIWLHDFYHSLLTMGWGSFFLVFVAFFLLFNVFFGFLYWLEPHNLSSTDGSYWQDFVFSVQTFSTIGYGVFSPTTGWAHTIMVNESILSVFVTAVLTGLIFSKFARPTARIIFSKNILIHNFDGKRTLSLRLGNLRGNQIAEAQVRMIALKNFVTSEGQKIRRQLDLKLVRDSSLFFALSWTIMHVIDESSPFYHLSAQDIIDQDIEVGVSLIGHDSTFAQTVQASIIYCAEDFVFDQYFEDILEYEDGEIRQIRYDRFHNLQKS